MHSELYADGIGEITVSGTVVRVDLVSLSPTERDASNAPKSVFRQRLIFSIEGFANAVQLMQEALQGLVEGGAVTRTRRVPATGPAAPAPDNTERAAAVGERPRAPNLSPNFC